MPRLVEINAACNSGGTGRIAEKVGVLAKNAGWEVLYVHGARYVYPSQLQTLCVQPRGLDYLHYGLSLLTGHHGLFSYLTTQRLIRHLRRFQPDIVHLHNVHGYYLNYKLLFRYLRETDIPVVWTWHDCWPMTGHCACYSTETGTCTLWKTGCHDCPKRMEYPRAIVDSSKSDFQLKKQLFCAIDKLTIVPVSYWMERNVQQSFLKDKPICVIRNGINLQIFYPRENRSALRKKWGIEQSKYVLLGVATQWNMRKGYPDILSLAQITNCQLILVGLTKQQCATLPAGIIGIEHTESQEELAQLYSLADLFVNPTYSDTFPTTNLEALACGTPVLTYDTDGSPETLDEQVGVVVKRGNQQGLQEAIRQLQTHPLDREACAKYARERYNGDTCFSPYLQLFKQLLHS